MDYKLGLIYKGILRNERLNGRFMQDSKVSRKEGDLRAVSQRLAGTQSCSDWQGRSVQILKTGPWTWEWYLVHGPSCFLGVFIVECFTLILHSA